jgi:hypothetical protein
MKKITIALAFLIIFKGLAHAQSPAPDLNTDYLKKSRQQKTLATISLITGGSVALVGGYLWLLSPIAGISEHGNVEGARRTGQTLVAIGGSLVAVSIPLFNASKKNKKKAELYMGGQVMQLPDDASARQLAVGLRVNF